jgi:hypothetical protein
LSLRAVSEAPLRRTQAGFEVSLRKREDAVQLAHDSTKEKRIDSENGTTQMSTYPLVALAQAVAAASVFDRG